MDNYTDLFVFCRILYEFLLVLLYHFFQLLQLRRRLSLDLQLMLWLFSRWWKGNRFRSWLNGRGWVTIRDGTCKVDGFLHFFMVFVEHIVQFYGLLGGSNLTGFDNRTAILPLLVVYLLLFLLLKTFHILLLKTSTSQFRRSSCSTSYPCSSQFIFEHGMIGQISWCLIGFGNNLQIRWDFIFSGWVELIFNDTQQSLIKFEQSINFSLMTFTSLLQFLKFIFAWCL